MGRQINFYMYKDIQYRFIEYLKENEYTFLDVRALTISDTLLDGQNVLYLYKQEYGNIIMSQNGSNQMNILDSPIIEFRKTMVKDEKHRIIRGRVWIESQYYNDDGIAIYKKEMFLNDYQKISRWIKKNVPYQQIKKGNDFIKVYINNEMKELMDSGYALM